MTRRKAEVDKQPPAKAMAARAKRKADAQPTAKATSMPLSKLTAQDAVENARHVVQHPNQYDLTRLCLNFVRDKCWHIPSKYETARDAWEAPGKRHPFTTVHAIPFGAPVFSRRPGAGKDDAGHVFIAGGYNRRGERIFRSTDIRAAGEVDCCQIEDFVNVWGHEILGWREDLNGVKLRLPAPPKARK